MIRPRRSAGFACVAGALLLAWAAHAQPLEVATSRGPVSLPVYVAHAEGFFKAQRLQVHLRECSSGRACFQLLDAGTADLATAAEVVVTLNGFRRDDLTIIATLSTSSHQIKFIARRGAGIAVPADLRGKRVGTVAGTSAHYFLDTWLIFHEIDARSVAMVPIQPEQLAPALRRHDIDAVAIWEPYAAVSLSELGEDAVTLPNPRIYTQHFNLVTTRATQSARRNDLLKLLRALLDAERFIAQQPLKARDILSHRLGISPSEADARLREHDYRLRLEQALVATMSSQVRWAIREGHVPRAGKGVDPLGLVEPELLRRVAPKAVTVVR